MVRTDPGLELNIMKYKMPETGPQYPSKREMLRNLALSAAQAASDPRPTPRTLKERRLEICNVCEWFDGQQLRCKACGCYLVAKAALRGSKCPKGKWEELPDMKDEYGCC